jgi:hypothetical protein
VKVLCSGASVNFSENHQARVSPLFLINYR